MRTHHTLTVDGDCKDEDSSETDWWKLGRNHPYNWRGLREDRGHKEAEIKTNAYFSGLERNTWEGRTNNI